MIRYNHIKQYKPILFSVLAIAVLMTSCISEEVLTLPYPKPTSGYIKIHLNRSDLNIPTGKTYGMNSQPESAIDPAILSIIVFDYSNNGSGVITETFNYMAPISGAITYEDNKAIVIVKLEKSSSSGEQYRIVVIANHDLSEIELVRNVTTKNEVLEQLTFSQTGKWNTDIFPMWGESMPIIISDHMPTPTIDLCRALARIDVGLNFVADNGKLTEQAIGIADFKLSEVLVFRTFDKGYVAPINDNAIEIPDVTPVSYDETPSVPPGALRHADNYPLDYIIPDIGGVNAFVREIYVPEADLPSTPDNGNIHCLVIGGYYQNSSVTSYYRLDFAKETEPGARTYLPILRNHRYVFNINQVTGPGFSSAILALESMPAVANVDYDLVAWDATIHEMETQGQYYFGIDNRDLIAEAPSTNSEPNNKFTVKYQTNYPLSASDPVRFEWSSVVNDPFSSPIFDAQWHPEGKNILITVINDNLTNTLLSDTLYVYAGPFVKKIVVSQKCFDVKYTIDCSSIVAKGTYKRGITLNPSEHYISLSITADNRSMQGRTYVIETTDPHSYGISFRAEGIFDFTGIPEGSPLRIDNIRMEGNGTLQTPVGEKIFSLPIVSDSPTGSSCDATIQFIIPNLNILVLSNINDYDGYAISRKQGGAGKLFNSPNNFGSDVNSIVKVEGFTYISTTNYNFAYSTTSDGYKWVTGKGNNGKIADIVYIAFPAFFEAPTASLLVDYLDKGGVIVAFLENASIQYLAGYLFNSTINYNEVRNQLGSIYPFPAHSSNILNENDLQNVLSKYEGDPILNEIGRAHV